MDEDTKPFFIEKAKQGRASCKKCKQTISAGYIRMAKVLPNPFGSGMMKHWFHYECIFESFERQKETTRRIESFEDIEGWDDISEDIRDTILEKITKLDYKSAPQIKAPDKKLLDSIKSNYKMDSKDNMFREFRRICSFLSDESSYLKKTAILHNFFLKGCNGSKFEGDLYLWVKLLLPTAVKRIYNLQSKQLVKLFARIFNTDQEEMLIDLEQGDVSETILAYFEKSKSNIKAASKSLLRLDEVDLFLDHLAKLSKEEEQIEHFKKICAKCTSNDLKMIIRFIKHDLRINSGPKHILEALSPEAYTAFQSSRDIQAVVLKFGNKISEHTGSILERKELGKNDSVGVQLMIPFMPMLAEACKSIDKAIEKCPDGIYSEVKYDGERVQLHKKGNEFRFFSRNLKQVQDHKIHRCKEFVPKAFPTADELILDSEIIVVDTETGDLLPFGTLGIHKKTQFKSAEVCLFVFDCIYYNGQDLTKKTMKERRKILENTMKPIKNHVQLSEYQFIKTKKELSVMIAKVLQMGLEGLVLKNVNGIYEPNKRHWLKVKKDYLFDGIMADSADLVVLGAWFGTGKKGGKLSIFLMGCFDENSKLWKTVTKVHSGLDDKTIDELQKLKKLMERSDDERLPKWLNCKKAMTPDMLAVDPFKMPVWEIVGAEFSKAEGHTADGISIRFPRIKKIRDDKSPKQATTLNELKSLYKNSKDHIDIKLITDDIDEDEKNNGKNIMTKYFSPNKNEPCTSKIEEKPKQMDKTENLFCDFNKEISDDKKEKELNTKRKLELEIENSTNKKNKINHSENSSTAILTTSSNIEDKLQSENLNKNSNVNVEIDLNIFKTISIFIPTDVLQVLNNEIEYFLDHGGRILDNPKNSNYVLHKDKTIIEDISVLRSKYSSKCKHVHYTWLSDCIKNEEILSVIKYPVFLSNKSD